MTLDARSVGEDLVPGHHMLVLEGLARPDNLENLWCSILPLPVGRPELEAVIATHLLLELQDRAAAKHRGPRLSPCGTVTRPPGLAAWIVTPPAAGGYLERKAQAIRSLSETSRGRMPAITFDIQQLADAPACALAIENVVKAWARSLGDDRANPPRSRPRR